MEEEEAEKEVEEAEGAEEVRGGTRTCRAAASSGSSRIWPPSYFSSLWLCMASSAMFTASSSVG